MQKVSNKNLLHTFFILLLLVVVAKALSILLWWYLPSDGVTLPDKKSYGITYNRIDFKNMLTEEKIIQSKPAEKEKVSNAYSINDLVLKGLYGNESYGYAIVAKKISLKKTVIVSVGEVFEGYKLQRIELNQVIFTKGSKEYVLKLDEAKIKRASHVNRVKKVSRRGNVSDSEKRVTRKDINSYASNPSKIWKDISIVPLKKFGKIEGFKVTRIKKGSKMAELGLQKGDIILEANNVKLSSFNDAIKLYKNINKLDTIALIVERNHEEKEIIYEIR